MTNETLFQQLVDEEAAEEMLDVLEDTNWVETARLEIVLAIREEDSARIKEELEEIVNEDG